MAALVHHVPGVYYAPRTRAPEPAIVRTDVVGFIGFDPRIRNGTTPSAVTLLPPSHAFRVDVAGFQVEVDDHGARGRYVIPATRDFELSAGPGVVITPGQSIVYGLAV